MNLHTIVKKKFLSSSLFAILKMVIALPLNVNLSSLASISCIVNNSVAFFILVLLNIANYPVTRLFSLESFTNSFYMCEKCAILLYDE